MIIDGAKIKQPQTADVCIVGSGAAGVTLAWYLQQAGYDVVLAEAGRPGSNYLYADKRIFYYGETLGRFENVAVYAGPDQPGAFNDRSFLIRPATGYQSGPSERERTYGGTTYHFGGQSRPLDPIVFEAVDGYPAWPVDTADLQPFFDEAVKFCDLQPSFEADYWKDQVNGAVPRLENFNTEMYQFIGPNDASDPGYKNFATRLFGRVIENGRPTGGKAIGDTSVRVIRNANLVQVDKDGSNMTHMHFASLDGGGEGGGTPNIANRFTVEARCFVLATGAVENARQMLLAGIDNTNIGKYFMCHPLVASYLDGLGNPLAIYGSYLTDAELGLMDGTMVSNGVNTGQKWTDDFGVTIEGRFIPDAAITKQEGIGRCWFWAGGGTIYFEQAPNENSCVSLSQTEKDPVFGQPLTLIDWQFSPADKKTYETTVKLFQAAVAKINGSVTIMAADWNEIVERAVINGHHLGTTRMSDSAADGVVDKNLKSHDVDNLYVAGSSVWRTAGISNPTFTIIAFSIRLAQHLGGILGKPAAKR